MVLWFYYCKTNIGFKQEVDLETSRGQRRGEYRFEGNGNFCGEKKNFLRENKCHFLLVSLLTIPGAR